MPGSRPNNEIMKLSRMRPTLGGRILDCFCDYMAYPPNDEYYCCYDYSCDIVDSINICIMV